ncbi:MAG: hypothetical protein JWO43_114 [Candidatus Adlerbacteria bacterium]|nr:hypothetical protein [Candidatus Adlerbacteria bacterium]
MNKFLVLYMAPAATMKEWMEKPEAERKESQDKMETEWNQWMAAHAASMIETAGAGKTTQVSAEGAKEVTNDVMMYSLVNGESKEAVAAMFVGHPHFMIPGATIDIMPANMIPGMAK